MTPSSRSPLAVTWRTFLYAMTAVLTTAMGADLLTNWKIALPPLVIATIGAGVTGVSAGLLAWRGALQSDTPTGRGLAQFLQQFGAGIVTIVLADLTQAALVSYGNAVGRLAVSSLIAGVLAYATNASEQSQAAPAQQ